MSKNQIIISKNLDSRRWVVANNCKFLYGRFLNAIAQRYEQTDMNPLILTTRIYYLEDTSKIQTTRVDTFK